MGSRGRGALSPPKVVAPTAVHETRGCRVKPCGGRVRLRRLRGLGLSQDISDLGELKDFRVEFLAIGCRFHPREAVLDPQEHADWELMQRVAASDETAIDALYARFGVLVFQSARQVLGSRAETEDAVQEIFVRLWRTADRFDPHRAKLVTWVMLITRRHLIDRLRRQSSRPDRLQLDEARFEGPTSGRNGGGATKAGGTVETDESRERLLRQMARLPELQRTVIERAYLQGYSLRDIAEQLDAPIGTIKSALSRGLTKLRELEGIEREQSRGADGGGA